jgi:hypothetical protein
MSNLDILIPQDCPINPLYGRNVVVVRGNKRKRVKYIMKIQPKNILGESERTEPEDNDALNSEGQGRNEDIFEPRDNQRSTIGVTGREGDAQEPEDPIAVVNKTSDIQENWMIVNQISSLDKNDPEFTQIELASISTSDWRTPSPPEKNAVTSQAEQAGVSVPGSADKYVVTEPEDEKVNDGGAASTPDLKSIVSVIGVEYCCCTPDTRPPFNSSRTKILGVFQIVCALMMLALAASIVLTEKLYHYTGLVGPFAIFILSGAFAVIASGVDKFCVRNFSLFLACFTLPLSAGCIVVASSDLHHAVSGSTRYFSNSSVSRDAILSQHVLFAVVSVVNFLLELALIRYASLGVQMDCLPEDDSEDEYELDIRQAQRESVCALRDDQRRRLRREYWQQHARESKLI